MPGKFNYQNDNAFTQKVIQDKLKYQKSSILPNIDKDKAKKNVTFTTGSAIKNKL
jgi:hypothetical protein